MRRSQRKKIKKTAPKQKMIPPKRPGYLGLCRLLLCFHIASWKSVGVPCGVFTCVLRNRCCPQVFFALCVKWWFSFRCIWLLLQITGVAYDCHVSECSRWPASPSPSVPGLIIGSLFQQWYQKVINPNQCCVILSLVPFCECSDCYLARSALSSLIVLTESYWVSLNLIEPHWIS